MTCPDAWSIWSLARSGDELSPKRTSGFFGTLSLVGPYKKYWDTPGQKGKFQFWNNTWRPRNSRAILKRSKSTSRRSTFEPYFWDKLQEKSLRVASQFKRQVKMRSDVRLWWSFKPQYRARTGRPRDKKGDPQALMMLLLAFGIVLLRFLDRAEQQRRKERRQAELALRKLEQTARRRSQGATYWKWKKRHVTPHVGLQSQKPEMRSAPKRKWSFGNVAKRRLVPLFQSKVKIPTQKCFDWFSRDPEAWRAQKEKDNRRQQKCRAKKSLGANAAKAPGGATRCPNWLWWPQCLQHRRTTTTWRFWRSCQRCRRGTDINESYHFVTIKDSWSQHDKQNLSHHLSPDRRGGSCWSSWRKKREYVLSKFRLGRKWRTCWSFWGKTPTTWRRLAQSLNVGEILLETWPRKQKTRLRKPAFEQEAAEEETENGTFCLPPWELIVASNHRLVGSLNGWPKHSTPWVL